MANNEQNLIGELLEEQSPSDMDEEEDDEPAIRHLLTDRELFIMRHGDLLRSVEYDELLVLFFFQRYQKYPHYQQLSMSQSHVRHVVRLLNLMKSNDDRIMNLADIYRSKFFDVFIQSINEIGQLAPRTRQFRRPAVVLNLIGLVKQIGELLKMEYVRKRLPSAQTKVEEFIELLNRANIDLEMIVKNSSNIE